VNKFYLGATKNFASKFTMRGKKIRIANKNIIFITFFRPTQLQRIFFNKIKKILGLLMI